MVSARHSKQTSIDGNHSIVSYIYANATARLAADSFTTIDLYKVSYQQDNGTLWMLTNISPITWRNLVFADE